MGTFSEKCILGFESTRVKNTNQNKSKYPPWLVHMNKV